MVDNLPVAKETIKLYTSFLMNPYCGKIYCVQIRLGNNINLDDIKKRTGLCLQTNNADTKKHLRINEKEYGWAGGFFIAHIEDDLKDVYTLSKQKLEELNSTLNAEIKSDEIHISDIKENTDLKSVIGLPFFVLRDYLEGKTTDISERIKFALDAFQDYNETYDVRHAYYSAYSLCVITEELLFRIAQKESISLNEGFSIGANLKTLKGKPYLLSENPATKSADKDGLFKVKLLDSNLNSKNVFNTKPDNEQEGKIVIDSVERINGIRTTFAHYGLKSPHLPDDVLLLTVYFGQFLTWCEYNGYI
ncbi:MAG: hypothetical protein NTX79_01930 [Candidatus Micrarchaeota archaeon]|nr:hypothetical protein [Candidatus Micrarchaeota archaeon]